MELTNATCLTVLPRSATPLKAPLLVIGGNRFRCLRLVADQPKPMPCVPPTKGRLLSATVNLLLVACSL
jgi:hypothetical protein